LASAFMIHEGGSPYLQFVTTNDSEKVLCNVGGVYVGKDVGGGVVLSTNSGIEWGGQLTVTGALDLSEGVNHSHYICSGSSAIVVSLPEASNGVALYVKRHSAMTADIKVAADGSETIDGSTDDLVLENAGASVQLVASGSAWYIY